MATASRWKRSTARWSNSAARHHCRLRDHERRAVRRAIERGIAVIIPDHHLLPGTLPDAAAVLNPKQPA
jgi:hypothetical protein